MPVTYAKDLRFIIGGEIVNTEAKATSVNCQNVYEGKTKPGMTSQLFTMSLTLDEDPIK